MKRQTYQNGGKPKWGHKVHHVPSGAVGFVTGISKLEHETNIAVLTVNGSMNVAAGDCQRGKVAFEAGKAPVKRDVALKWLPKLCRDLTDIEKELTTAALGDIPWDDYCGSLEHLWERYHAGEVGCLVLLGEDGKEHRASSFYELLELVSGELCFESLCTVATGPTDRRIEDIKSLEELARSIDLSGKKVTSMAMRTPRHGLAKQLVEKHGWYVSEITLRKILK